MLGSREAQPDIIMANGLPLPTRQTRKNLVIATLVFCWSTIALILWLGSPENSLHSSALSWSYALSVGVIFAYAFGAVVDNYNFLNAVKREQ